MSGMVMGLSPRGRGSPVQVAARLLDRGSIPAWAGEPGSSSTGTRPTGVYPRVGGGATGTHGMTLRDWGLSPRGRGSPFQSQFRGVPAGGLSPRGRGSPQARREKDDGLGSIPAWAGEPGSWATAPGCRRVYPRVGGGAACHSAITGSGRGLSPRGRGSRFPSALPAPGSGSIPAWAGEPDLHGASQFQNRVYPRVGGGAGVGDPLLEPVEGLSPRGRGSRPSGIRNPVRHGSIPAWAGEPRITRRGFGSSRVYPRVGGGAANRAARGRYAKGLSPRGRGSPHHRTGRVFRRGSIPAWAGEPSRGCARRSRARVYPRVGGGARQDGRCGRFVMGLSPRGRGSRGRVRERLPPLGSIPAWAGEPAIRGPSRRWGGVYPRVGGGATRRARAHRREPGLSPRGRGSRPWKRRNGRNPRSIPAWAGEPAPATRQAHPAGVYPRVGGGAPARGHGARSVAGLSPRGRGSPVRTRLDAGTPGSIPAWAGEPSPTASSAPSSRVYPRVGGGAIDARVNEEFGKGLSPRGRGSLHHRKGVVGDAGSIPAWAGEPRQPQRCHRAPTVYPRVGGGAGFGSSREHGPEKVYPRVSGGADSVHVIAVPVKGLSPRGRGSLGEGRHAHARGGSIPAWAGEPWPEAGCSPEGRVYPRVGGGAGISNPGRMPALGLSPRGRGSL